MTWLYLVAATAFCLAPLATALPAPAEVLTVISSIVTGGRFGSLPSGAWIPLLNVLVAIKVTLGSWAMVQLFMRHRGLL
jgi:multisubunit Na+/H+ antiporter MnhB subunit